MAARTDWSTSKQNAQSKWGRHGPFGVKRPAVDVIVMVDVVAPPDRGRARERERRRERTGAWERRRARVTTPGSGRTEAARPSSPLRALRHASRRVDGRLTVHE